jgi:hypothetical protein
VSFFENAYEVAKGADALLLLTEWMDYRGLRLVPQVFAHGTPSGAGCAQCPPAPEKMKGHGFEYQSSG